MRLETPSWCTQDLQCLPRCHCSHAKQRHVHRCRDDALDLVGLRFFSKVGHGQ